MLSGNGWNSKVFVAGNFALAVSGNETVITDQAGGSLAVRCDPVSRTVDETA